MSCIKFGRKGHAASECRQAKVEQGDRPCFTYGKTGHEARVCPEKPLPRAPLQALEDVPRRVAALCITDADGFTKVPPRRSGQRLADLIASAPAPHCNSNRFWALSLEDWQDVAAKVADELKIRSSMVLNLSFCASAFPILSLPTTSSPSGQGEKVMHVPILASTAPSAQPANCSAASIAVVNNQRTNIGPDHGANIAGNCRG